MYRTPSLRAIVLTSSIVRLNFIADVREMTRRDPIWDRSAVTSSVRPSAKYSFSGSVLRFVNGRTAIDVVRATACSGEPLTGVDGLVRR